MSYMFLHLYYMNTEKSSYRYYIIIHDYNSFGYIPVETYVAKSYELSPQIQLFPDYTAIDDGVLLSMLPIYLSTLEFK